jgi:hypothetical protein
MSSQDPNSSEQEAYRSMDHWLPINQVYTSDFYVNPSRKLFILFDHCYSLTKTLYDSMPKRRNGEKSLMHPLNVIYALKKAGINDPITLSIGLLHDYVEERVDLYKTAQGIKEDAKGIQILDNYEKYVIREFKANLEYFCEKNNLSEAACDVILNTVKLLTRHKRHFYYRSISQIFSYPDDDVRERAIQVKLADRMHNILSIECFDERGRLYQCFKNLFILNNVKTYIFEKYGKDTFLQPHKIPTAQLFTKCASATYDGFLTICNLCGKKDIARARFTLQLAFKKYAYLNKGLTGVTKLDTSETEPVRLFQGVVWKYDSRLHHEWDKFDNIINEEISYCKKFFNELHYSKPQLQAVLDYKDAFALKEVMAHLLYQPKFYISGFTCSELSQKGRIKKR